MPSPGLANLIASQGFLAAQPVGAPQNPAMGMHSIIGKMPAPEAAGPGMQRESMLGEWIGVSLERFLDVTGRQPRSSDGDRASVTVLAAEVQPRRHAQLPVSLDGPATRSPERAAAAVTIVKWRVYDAVSDTGARKVR
jgi:hypothetical protein